MTSLLKVAYNEPTLLTHVLIRDLFSMSENNYIEKVGSVFRQKGRTLLQKFDFLHKLVALEHQNNVKIVLN